MSFQRILSSGPLEQKVRQMWKDAQERFPKRLTKLWRRWKLLSEYDFSPPIPEEWHYDFPLTRTPDCANCKEICCQGKHNTVLLRLIDVARFVDKGLTDYITLEKPTFSPEFLVSRPALQATMSSFHWDVFPVLKQKEDERCIFLHEEGHCTIHPDRPWICRVFPYFLDIDEKTVRWSSRCKYYKDEAPNNPIVKELKHAVFHSFYVEKICDLFLMSVFPEELKQLGFDAWIKL